jgi:hypothetical protein
MNIRQVSSAVLIRHVTNVLTEKGLTSRKQNQAGNDASLLQLHNLMTDTMSHN